MNTNTNTKLNPTKTPATVQMLLSSDMVDWRDPVNVYVGPTMLAPQGRWHLLVNPFYHLAGCRYAPGRWYSLEDTRRMYRDWLTQIAAHPQTDKGLYDALTALRGKTLYSPECREADVLAEVVNALPE